MPSTISGDSHTSGLSFQCTMKSTATGNIRLAGKAARNCATACSRSDQRGFMPTHTPTGTHTSAAIAISTSTRTSVYRPSTKTWPTSCQPTSPWMKRSSHSTASSTAPESSASPMRAMRGSAGRGRARTEVPSKRRGNQARLRAAPRASALPAARTARVRRSQVSSHEWLASALAPSSKRNLSAQATSGRKKSWSYSRMPISIARIAQPMAARSRASMAMAMYEPTPGSLMLWFDTEMASEATTKNQPPDIDIIMFHSRPGIAKGSSSRQKRCQPESWNTAAASPSSEGTVRIDWYRLKAMFQACEVKMAKMAAHSTPSRLPGKSAMKPVTVIDRKPSTGMDCSTSSSGTSTRSATRYLAASTANTQAKTSDAPSARNMRSVVRSR